MKLKAIFVFMAVLAIGVSSSLAAIDWAGNIWPCAAPNSSGYFNTNQDITVYAQVYIDGCTSGVGQCEGIVADLFYKKATDATYTQVAMTYNGEVYNNDEYMATIPSSVTEIGVNMEAYVVFYDTSDFTEYTATGDQCGSGSIVTYEISNTTSQDVTVTFRVDMNCINPSWYAGGVNFVGSHTGWGMCAAGTEMTDPDLDGIYEGTWLFAAGSNYNWEYKFQRNDGSSCYWMDGGNFSFTIDDSGPMQVLDVVPWVIYPSGPGEISGPGSYCVTVDCTNELWIALNTPYNPPTINQIMIAPGCNSELTNCDDPNCSPGIGEVVWDIRQGENLAWYLVLRVYAGGYYGCFCITIDQILPVELAAFDAIAGDNEVTLRWTTGSETDNDYFSIMRDGTEVTRVNAHGNATGSDYAWVDNSVRNGVTYEYTLINVDVDGSRTVLETASATPNHNNANVLEYSLAQNYPNPFNPTTSIAYSLEEAGLVNITVFDITGREVATLVNGVMTAGSHSVEFDAAGLPSGIYMYRMEAGDFSAVQKMVLMK